MSKTEIDLIRGALDLLRRAVPDDGEPQAVDSAARRCPVSKFVRKFLVRDPVSDVTSAELFQFYGELVAGRELDAVSKTVFLRCLPGTMEATFGVRKAHNIERNGHFLRGFKGVNLNQQA